MKRTTGSDVKTRTSFVRTDNPILRVCDGVPAYSVRLDFELVKERAIGATNYRFSIIHEHLRYFITPSTRTNRLRGTGYGEAGFKVFNVVGKAQLIVEFE